LKQRKRITKSAGLLNVARDKVRLFLGGYFWENMENKIELARILGYGVLFEDGTDISVRFES
jgi:hypothetical protein